MRAVIVVLGDLGRSPRMQYHALALADSRAEVDVIGYGGSAPVKAVCEHPHIRLHLLHTRIDQTVYHIPSFLFIPLALMRMCSQGVRTLWILLFVVQRPDVILVQIPPAIPSLLIALLAARARSSRLVLDWHNFGYSVLALRMGSRSRVVRLARFYEQTLGRRADGHLCVSRMMQAELAAQWGIPNATVLYDRPASWFAPTPLKIRRDLLRRICRDVGFPLDLIDYTAIIVSSTSWSADEDLSILLEAARRCDDAIKRAAEKPGSHAFPDLLILITGRGPLRDQFECKMRALSFRKIHLRTLWLTPEDYPLLLGSADLGLSCHRSSSGVDLPMKIADLFGAGVPVGALDYGPCIAEQVRDGETGFLFADAAELADRLYDLFERFPDEMPILGKLRGNVVRLRSVSWFDGWKAEAAAVLFATR